MTGKPGEVRTNVDKVCEQYRFGGPINRVHLKRAAMEANGTYTDKDNSIYQVQVDDKGRITKFTQRKVLGGRNFQRQGESDAVLFNYNENGDISQIILDNGDDGDYENIYDYNCKYDKNGNLISREETKWSKMKNMAISFWNNMPVNN